MDPIKFPIHHILPVLCWFRWYPGQFFFFYSAAAFADWWGGAIGLIHHGLARLGIFLSLTLFHSLSCLQPHVLIETRKKRMSNFLPLVCSPATSRHLSLDLLLKNEIFEPRARHGPFFHHLFNLALRRELVYLVIRFCMLVEVMQQLIGPH